MSETESSIDSIQKKYQEIIRAIMTFRLRVITLLGGFLHLSFTLFDKFIYPNQYGFLTRVRLIGCFLIFLAWSLTFVPWFQKRIRAVITAIFILAPATTCLMIWGTDGTASRYYEGLNLMTLAMLIANGFDWKLNVSANLFVLITYTAAVFFSAHPFDVFQYAFNVFFMGSTTAFVGLMTRFFGDQHYKAFSRNEILQQTRRKIAQLYSLADEKAKRDELTCAYTERYAVDLLIKKMEISKKIGRHFYIALMSIQSIKNIQEQYGRPFWDQVLQTSASVLIGAVRNGTCVARYGGDSFLLIFDDTETAVFQKDLEDLSAAINRTEVSVGAISLQIAAIFGAVKFSPLQDYNHKQFLKLADRALLELKETGESKFKLIEEELN